MNDIFLSYKREDHARAALIVAALRKSGRTVWWDEGLTPRQAWDETIEQEIAAAASVIVLWSPQSVASDYVRSEAHYAQNNSKLVPVLIEPCTIPLAFMLRQTVDLCHWHGSMDDQAWCKLIEWLDTQAPPTTSPRLRGRRARLPGWPSRRTLIVAAFAIGALLAALFVYRSKADHAGAPSIRVARFDTLPGDQAAAFFSQGFAADLAQIVSSGGSKLQVFDGTAAGAAATNASDFTLNGSVRSEARDLHATLTLNSVADGAIIWSTSLTRPAAETGVMHHEAEVRMGAVFVCALDETARDRSIVSLDALKVYLQACEALPSGEFLHTRKLLRDVTALAPDFAQGWGTLAEWNGFIVGTSDDDAPAARKEALDAAARALAIDPRNSAAWVARGMTKTQIGEWSAAQADLAQALTLSPDDPIGNYFYASSLLNVGRTSEALDYAIRAANSGPQFWPKTLQVIVVLADLDRVDEAQAMLATALKTWPDNDGLKGFAAILAARYADPAKAAATLDDPAFTKGQSPARLRLLRLESDAREHSSQAAVEAAADAIKALYAGPDSAFGAAGNFIVIGRIDDAYAGIGAMRTHLRNAPYVENPSLFFRPFAARFRADARFMALAAKLGLVAIWRSTKWPDFCSARDAPYDCRAVAEKPAHQDAQTGPRE
ncbi:MAG TPA: TIR domain-containing protein [Steroidobacteraceae bacterium]|nr:TIR domain-containing protein [Steroidobacteraceae bacterium]